MIYELLNDKAAGDYPQPHILSLNCLRRSHINLLYSAYAATFLKE